MPGSSLALDPVKRLGDAVLVDVHKEGAVQPWPLAAGEIRCRRHDRTAIAPGPQHQFDLTVALLVEHGRPEALDFAQDVDHDRLWDVKVIAVRVDGGTGFDGDETADSLVLEPCSPETVCAARRS